MRCPQKCDTYAPGAQAAVPAAPAPPLISLSILKCKEVRVMIT